VTLPELGGVTFDPSQYGYPLRLNFDRRRLEKLLNEFESEIKREIDRKLAVELRFQLLSDKPHIDEKSFKRLARWCKTEGIYADAMYVARKISDEIFGRVIDREVAKT